MSPKTNGAKGKGSKVGSLVWVVLCSACSVFVMTLLGIYILRTPEGETHRLRATAQRSDFGAVPTPPWPYTYDTFMDWFKRQNWDRHTDLRLPPRAAWFDVDYHLTNGPRKEWFVGKDMKAIALIAKQINRFIFLRQVMLYGWEASQASLPMHLLILWLLRHDLAPQHAEGGIPNRIVVLDAGCGTGYLLEAFALMSMSGSRIVGFDKEGVEEARRNIADQEVEGVVNGTVIPKPEVLQGDLRARDFGLDFPDVQKVLPKEYHVINVGVALPQDYETSPVFQRLVRGLRRGGALTVPVCVEPPRESFCSADFRLYRKNFFGRMVPEVEGAYRVRFAVLPTT